MCTNNWFLKFLVINWDHYFNPIQYNTEKVKWISHLLQTTYFKYFYSLLICLIKSTSNLLKKRGNKSCVKNTTLTKRSYGTSYNGCIHHDISKELKKKTIPLQLEDKNPKNVNLSDEIRYYFVFSIMSPSDHNLHVCSGVPEFLMKHHKYIPSKRDCFPIYVFTLSHSEAITILGHFLLPSYLLLYKLLLLKLIL